MQQNHHAITVFCGSALGRSHNYKVHAELLAEGFYRRGITLVYGGACVGLMGVIANKLLALGGEVIGVMPQSLVDCEVAHKQLSQMHVVNSIAERKQLMAELSDGFIMMPGGIGSLDEFFEMMIWAQLDFHQKPNGILNVDSYYDHLLQFLDHAVVDGFLQAMHRDMLVVSDSVDVLFDGLENYQAPCSKWVDDFVANNTVSEPQV